jgi:hypothetical protein
VPLGQPVAGARAFVLDRHGQPVPVGIPGELHLGGPGVARGYLGRPDLTAERFLPDPFSGEPGARLFRTGDRVCWRADNELEFLGRLDDQLKLRGVRLEPAEIESALAAHPAVQACAVAVREPRPGDPRLVAYLVPRQSSPTPDELSRFLRERLPASWVPSAFVTLPALPHLPGGKVDRAALPVPGSARPDLGTSYVPARNRLERRIAGLWREVLQIERVGVDDNFFDLGGRSLLLARVQGRLCEVLRREIPMIDLFRHPTVAALARHLGRGPEERPAFQQAQDRARRQKGAAPRGRRVPGETR